MTSHANDVTIILSCDHLTTGPLSKVLADSHAEFPCWACTQRNGGKPAHRRWVGIADGQGWWFTCTQCRYKRHYGMAQIRCNTAADKHVRARRHTVHVMLDTELHREIRSSQPALTDAPPF